MKRFKKRIFAPSIITVLLLISNVSSVGALSINGEDVDWNGRLAAGTGSRINLLDFFFKWVLYLYTESSSENNISFWSIK